MDPDDAGFECGMPEHDPIRPDAAIADQPTADAAPTGDAATADVAEVVFYWRPGCGFCSMLRRGLQRAGLGFREVDIWEHPEAAAYVRSVARGNETVPTLDVAGVGLVNPSVREVLDVLAERAPQLLPVPSEEEPEERRHFWRRG